MRPNSILGGVGAVVALLVGSGAGIKVNLNDDNSVKEAASTLAYGLMKYYTGNNTGDVPGNLPDPYFWWEAGAMFGSMVDYWFLTNDTTYNNVTQQALVHQAGEDKDFMPMNQTRTEGNDDQGFWAMAAMSAAENGFPNPPPDQPQWLALTQAVFNEMVARWDTQTCNGGLRWQIFTFNNGYNYKNAISNGCFFNIAARLARYTGNQTYADWAEKIWDWTTGAGFISPNFEVFDGALVDQNCTALDKAQWTYNAGIFLHSAAVMYNHTNGTTAWGDRVRGLLNETVNYHFDNGLMIERPCEQYGMCDNDQQSFKAYYTRWLAGTMKMAPFTYKTIKPLLMASANAAAQQCSGNPDPPAFKGIANTACGFTLTNKTRFDGMVGVGEQQTGMALMMYNLIKQTEEAQGAPLTASTGGTSVGNPNAGADMEGKMRMLPPITEGDRVAAGFLTTAVTMSLLGGCFFLMKE